MDMDETNIKKNFGSIIRKYRHIKEISQEELAARTGLHRTYISEVERGERNVSLVNIVKISTGLEVNPSIIFKGLEEENNK